MWISFTLEPVGLFIGLLAWRLDLALVRAAIVSYLPYSSEPTAALAAIVRLSSLNFLRFET